MLIWLHLGQGMYIISHQRPWKIICNILIIQSIRYHLVEKEHDSGEGSHQSGCSEDRTPGAMARAITVHADTKKVMYFA